MSYAPETDKVRSHFAKYIKGPHESVLELGHGGGRPLVDWALCVERAPGADHRADCGSWPTHLVWDLCQPLPFTDNTFPVVTQSHVVEDFRDTLAIMNEMVRVTKPGGFVLNFLPDEQAYRKHCKATGQEINSAHVHMDMSVEYMRKIASKMHGVEVVEAEFPFRGCPYSFTFVLIKL